MNKAFEFFEHFARKVAILTGRPISFALAMAIVLLWALTGPIFNYSDTWQLVINTGTTIVTFLMVFLVQSAQNRDSKAIQLKLDELILKMNKADNLMLDIEQLTERELDQLAAHYNRIREKQTGPASPVSEAKEALAKSLKPKRRRARPAPSSADEQPATPASEKPRPGRRRRRQKSNS